VRLNPALDGLLGLEEVKRWREVRERVLTNELVRAGEVIDAFGTLAKPRGRTFVALPGKDASVAAGHIELVCAAALFNAEFIGQSISEDLRQLRGADPAGTALEVALRVGGGNGDIAPAPIRPAERERFSVVASDPSQDEAVLRARQPPGLLVEGPPGTGKSQTIVNTVADAIGRRETVLVVCQKQAALRVVEKRLEAEGLGNRLLAITDVNADRIEVIRSLLAQLGIVRGADPAASARLKQEREALARSIDSLEAEIDRHHEALHVDDARLGLSYRLLIGQLVGLEDGSNPPLSVPGLRKELEKHGDHEVEELADRVGPLAPLWRTARFEGSALAAVRPFLADEALAAELEATLASFAAVEAERQCVTEATAHALAMTDPEPYRAWLDTYSPGLQFAETPLCR
jgi:primosomal replication protein N''